VLLAAVRWFIYTLLPSLCPECGGLLTPILRRSAIQIGAVLRPGDPRRHLRSDWLCCESCDFVRSLDLHDERS
jgi:hypothetical protein